MTDVSQFVAMAMALVAETTGLPVPEHPPMIIELPHCEVQAYVDKECDPGYGAMGFYTPGTDLIVMSDWYKDVNPTYYQATIIHEVVHYFQDKAGVWETYESCQLEAQAYQLQQAYMRYKGQDDTPEYFGGLHSMNTVGTCSTQE